MDELVRYDAMCRAIADCVAVDEVMDIRDKAAALQAYYRQAGNVEAERDAARIRTRAAGRAGELLRDMQRTPGQRTDLATSPHDGDKSEYAQALADNGISTQEASRLVALADMPSEKFEAALADPDTMPTPRGVIERYFDERRAAGDEAALGQEVLRAAQGGGSPRRAARDTEYVPNPQFDAMATLMGSCRRILEQVEDVGLAGITAGFVDDDMRERNLATIRQARDALSRLLEVNR
jgi:hypothetical protein